MVLWPKEPPLRSLWRKQPGGALPSPPLSSFALATIKSATHIVYDSLYSSFLIGVVGTSKDRVSTPPGLQHKMPKSNCPRPPRRRRRGNSCTMGQRFFTTHLVTGEQQGQLGASQMRAGADRKAL